MRAIPVTASISAPTPRNELTLPEKISEGLRIDKTSSIRFLDVTTFLMLTVNTSKKPVEKTNETKPKNVIIPPIMKDAFI